MALVGIENSKFAFLNLRFNRLVNLRGQTYAERAQNQRLDVESIVGQIAQSNPDIKIIEINPVKGRSGFMGEALAIEFENNEARDAAIQSRLKIGQQSFPLDLPYQELHENGLRCYRKTLTFHNAPWSKADCEIQAALSAIIIEAGAKEVSFPEDVHKMTWKNTNIKRGVRKATIEVVYPLDQPKPTIPGFIELEVDDKTILCQIWYPGIDKFCRLCRKAGHFAKNCSDKAPIRPRIDTAESIITDATTLLKKIGEKHQNEPLYSEHRSPDEHLNSVQTSVMRTLCKNTDIHGHDGPNLCDSLDEFPTLTPDPSVPFSGHCGEIDPIMTQFNSAVSTNQQVPLPDPKSADRKAGKKTTTKGADVLVKAQRISRPVQLSSSQSDETQPLSAVAARGTSPKKRSLSLQRGNSQTNRD